MGYGLYTMGLFFDGQIARRYRARLILNFSWAFMLETTLELPHRGLRTEVAKRQSEIFSKADHHFGFYVLSYKN